MLVSSDYRCFNIQQQRLPDWEPPQVGAGRSIFLLVDIDAADVFEAVTEFFDNEHRGECSIEREDVRPQAGGVVGEVNEGEELSCNFGAFERVVSDVGEVALNGSFVGEYHIELI